VFYFDDIRPALWLAQALQIEEASTRRWQMTKKIFVAVMVAALLFIPTESRAESPAEPPAWFFALQLGQAAAMAGSVVTGIGTGVSIGVHERPSRGWLISSYVLGGLNLAGGIANLAMHEEFEWSMAMGAAQLTAASLNIILSSVALARRGRAAELPPPAGVEVAGMNLSVSPLVAPSVAGGPAVGMGLQLTGW